MGHTESAPAPEQPAYAVRVPQVGVVIDVPAVAVAADLQRIVGEQAAEIAALRHVVAELLRSNDESAPGPAAAD